MRVINTLLAAFSLTFSLSAQNTIADKLVAHFPFNNCSEEDVTGKGTFTAFDTLETTCTCGVEGDALQFNAPLDEVKFVGHMNSAFATSNFTVSFYMKPGTPPSSLQGAVQMVMSKQEDCTNNNTFWVRYRKKGQTLATSNILSTGISLNDSTSVTLSAKLDDDRCWHHIVISRDGVKFSLFVDGKKVAEKSSAFRLDITNQASFSMSVPKCPQDEHFYGELDEFRVYSRAFSEDEIEENLAFHPDEIITQDTVVYLGTSFEVRTTPSCADVYLWSPAAGVSNINVAHPTMSPEEYTQYILRFNYPDGCDAYDTLRVSVIDPDTLDCSQVFLPSAFTPGFSFGRNDHFFVSNPIVISDFISFEIFDRWGGRVFNATGPNDTWDGTFNGTPVNPGIFLYRIRYRCQGEEKNKTGTVTLLR